jgi:hypothetical protein
LTHRSPAVNRLIRDRLPPLPHVLAILGRTFAGSQQVPAIETSTSPGNRAPGSSEQVNSTG